MSPQVTAAAGVPVPTLLVVDDEPSILAAFRRAFEKQPVRLVTGGSAAEALELARAQRPAVIVLDVQLPDANGLETFRRLREQDPRSPVVFITGNSTTEMAIEAMKLGAFEYLLKPLELARLRQVIDQALAVSRSMHVPALVADGGPTDDDADVIVGRCPAMQEVYKSIGRVAGLDDTVLIVGETGTGKELVARAIYQHSRRSAGPFLAINCAALPDQLLESELFGHEKGAFTGAERLRIGKFEQCSGGTLFLDEVGDLSPPAQAKMLRVLQERTFERLGGNHSLRADVRILAATNQDLKTLVDQGRFRQDLFYRLSVFTIRLPPLRERGEDLPLLVRHYISRFAREMSKAVQAVTPEAEAALQAHAWPGNVRELQSVLKQALLWTTGTTVLSESLPPLPARSPAPGGSAGGQADASAVGDVGSPDTESLAAFIDREIRAGTEELYAKTLRRLERLLLTRVLEATGGNQLRAAKVLGITRGSLRTKLRELGIQVTRTVKPGEDGNFSPRKD